MSAWKSLVMSRAGRWASVGSQLLVAGSTHSRHPSMIEAAVDRILQYRSHDAQHCQDD
jgi:hypothetical protein